MSQKPISEAILGLLIMMHHSGATEITYKYGSSKLISLQCYNFYAFLHYNQQKGHKLDMLTIIPSMMLNKWSSLLQPLPSV